MIYSLVNILEKYGKNSANCKRVAIGRLHVEEHHEFAVNVPLFAATHPMQIERCISPANGRRALLNPFLRTTAYVHIYTYREWNFR